MLYVESQLSSDHIELLKIFFSANELYDIDIIQKDVDIRGVSHRFLHFVIMNEQTELKVTFMSLRHSGFLNMLDHYLLKCGVDVDELQPASYHRQLQNEKEEEQNQKFMEIFKVALNKKSLIS